MILEGESMVHWLSGTDIICRSSGWGEDQLMLSGWQVQPRHSLLPPNLLDLRFENGWIDTEIAPHGLKGPVGIT